MPHSPRQQSVAIVYLLGALLATSFLQAQVEPEETRSGAEQPYRHDALEIPALHVRLQQLPARTVERQRQRLARLGVAEGTARIDRRSGRFVTLLPSIPLIPGDGVGNGLQWADLLVNLEELEKVEPRDRAGREQAASAALLAFLRQHADHLLIRPEEFGELRIASHHDDTLYQIYIPRTLDGIPVRGSSISAVINHGNLTLMGIHLWGDRPAPAKQSPLGAEEAFLLAESSFSSLAFPARGSKAEMLYVPMVRPDEVEYQYQLVWALNFEVAGDIGNWEVLVDAYSGEILSREDTNDYAEVKGGVFPVSNDGMVPDGVEQAGWPMPYAEVFTSDGTLVTDTGGNVDAHGDLGVDLSGPYVRIIDYCGSISAIQTNGVDFGISGGTDCATPGFGEAGNTHASRTAFYALNKLHEMARGQLPGNSWVREQLTATMNRILFFSSDCRSFWLGSTSTVNFYRSGDDCANPGEIAGVLAHEWGHGMDYNDVSGPDSSASSREGFADIYAALWLNDSCIGRNSRPTLCNGSGDPCLSCIGLRDIDYLKRASGQPHDYSWALDNCSSSHCYGAVHAEAVWSLWKRKLQEAPYNYAENRAHEIVTRLTFLGGGATDRWYSGGPPFGGCSASSGYMNYLAADDDNGDLNDGTPHMTAIFEAFDDQEIACDTPMVQDAGCAAMPTTAPVVVATGDDRAVNLSWGPVAGATGYQVFRTEGVSGCDFGKVRLGETAGTTWSDTGLQNGRLYSYTVIPMGGAASCMGPSSACASATPGPTGPILDIDTSSGTLAISGGDSDRFLDNCEQGTMTFEVSNLGIGTLTNVRIVGVTPSNLGVSLDTVFPVPVSPSALGAGESGSGSFDFTAGGLAVGETLVFTVEVVADELENPKLADLKVFSTETDLAYQPLKTWSFEEGSEGWTTKRGIFESTSGGGGGGTTGFEQSSSFQHLQCDQITSPVVVLSSVSTLSMETNYDIEPLFRNGLWFDRANVGTLSGVRRTLVSPDDGRPYNAGGVNGSCGTGGQAGWADVADTWEASTWSATALGSAGLAGEEVQIDIRYGTDYTDVGSGFRFDEVTLTDVFTKVPDGQVDLCGCTVDADCDNGLYCDGVEACVAGLCQAGTAPDCDDGVACTLAFCDEDTDSCIQAPDHGLCDNGVFCDGAEVCDAVAGCQAGSDPCPVLGCNDITDQCDASVAVFDASLGVPACSGASPRCDSWDLLDGRGPLGPEPNQPNSLDLCTDGDLGIYHSDESNDRLVVKTLDGDEFSDGAMVQVDATVYGSGASDHLDLWYAADAHNPLWEPIATFDVSSVGEQTLSAQYTLPEGRLQAVRANFRRGGSANTCSVGDYDDVDDLVFLSEDVCATKVEVVLLNSAANPSYFDFPMLNTWYIYERVFDTDPAARFSTSVATSLDSESLAGKDVLVLATNAVLDSDLAAVDAWFGPGKVILAISNAVAYAAYSGYLWPEAVGTSGLQDVWDYEGLLDEQEVVNDDDFVTRGYTEGQILTSQPNGPAAFTVPNDAVVLTRSEDDPTNAYVVYRDVPEKGRIFLLGPYSRLRTTDLYSLIRNAGFSLRHVTCTAGETIFVDGFESGDLSRWSTVSP